MLRIEKLILLLLLFLGLNMNHAQQVQSDSITYLDEVILTDPAIEKGLGITDTQTIGASLLNTYGPLATATTLNQISGVNVLSGALNTNRITIRGVGSRTPFGTDKLRLYYENIPVTNGSGFSTIEAFDLENLYAMTIVKGPKATAYGGALGGAILLRVPNGSEHQKGLNFNITGGSYGLVKNNLALKIGDKDISMNLALNQLGLEGYRENNSFYRKGILLNTVYKIAPGQRLKFLANYIDYTAQIPSSLSLEDFGEDPRQAAANWKEARGFEANKYSLIGLTYEVDFTPGITMANTLFYNYLDHYEPRPFNILDEYTNTYGLRSVLAGNNRGRTLKYYLGLELLKDEYNWATYENRYRDNADMGSLQGDLLSDNKEFRRQFFAFGTLQYALSGNFTAQLGLQLNRTVYDFQDLFNTGAANRSARREFSWLLLPSLDLRYVPNEKLNLFVSFSRGFSNPSLEETLTPEGVINPDIEQETGVQIETGVDWNPVPGLNTAISVYEMDIQGLLVAERVGEDQFIGRNAGSTRLRGVETTLQYRTALDQNLALFSGLAYTYNSHRFKEFRDEDEDFSGNELTGVPGSRLHLRTGIQMNNALTLTAIYDYMGKIPITDANSIYSDPYHLFNIKADYKRKLSGRLLLHLNMGIQNIFDRQYAQSVLINATGFGGASPRYYYPGNGRNWYSSISFRWFF